MDELERKARIFKVLSEPNRVRIVELLKERNYCVNALANRLEITPAAVSQHLRILRDADIVTSEKHGYFVHYGLKRETLAEWCEITGELLHEDSQGNTSGEDE